MSVLQEQISRLKQTIGDCYIAISENNGKVPEDQTLINLPEAIKTAGSMEQIEAWLHIIPAVLNNVQDDTTGNAIQLATIDEINDISTSIWDDVFNRGVIPDILHSSEEVCNIIIKAGQSPMEELLQPTTYTFSTIGAEQVLTIANDIWHIIYI